MLNWQTVTQNTIAHAMNKFFFSNSNLEEKKPQEDAFLRLNCAEQSTEGDVVRGSDRDAWRDAH